MKFFSPQLATLPDCPPNAPVAGVVRIHLKDVLSASNGHVRNVRYKQKRDPLDDDKDAVGSWNSAPGNDVPEPFNVYLPTMNNLTLNPSELLEVRVVIKKRSRFEFTSVTDGTNTYTAIAAGPNSKYLCGPVTSGDTVSGNGMYASFFVIVAPSRQSAPTNDPFNIIVKITGSADTPIIIDPKIRNNG